MFHETTVWNGTSSLDPAVIYNDKQDGFMMQHARQGLWGFGTYFAERSSYSHDYAFKGPIQQSTYSNVPLARPPLCADEREMFLVTMLEGRTTHLSSIDSSLRVPPVHINTGQRFNSVTAVTNGSKVCVVYENGRAYPSYLVRYYRGWRDSTRTPVGSRAKTCYDWQFDGGPNNGWTSYSMEHQALLENARNAKRDFLLIFTPYHRYKIDFAKMTQTNISHQNKTVRRIRRRLRESNFISDVLLGSGIGIGVISIVATIGIIMIARGTRAARGGRRV